MPASTNPKPAARKTVRPPLPEAHADVALADINDLEALTRMKRSWLHEAVREGRFPAPVIRGSRCTRWKMSDVRSWLFERAAQPNAEAAEFVTQRAT